MPAIVGAFSSFITFISHQSTAVAAAHLTGNAFTWHTATFNNKREVATQMRQASRTGSFLPFFPALQAC